MPNIDGVRGTVRNNFEQRTTTEPPPREGVRQRPENDVRQREVEDPTAERGSGDPSQRTPELAPDVRTDQYREAITPHHIPNPRPSTDPLNALRPQRRRTP